MAQQHFQHSHPTVTSLDINQPFETCSVVV
jgi:hypothetical protein